MPVQKLYRVRCDCGHFLPKESVPAHATRVADPSATPLFTSHQDATAAALERGWTVYPLACPACKEQK